MSTPITNPRICKILQSTLGQTFDDLSYQSQKPVTGVVDALISAENTAGVVQLKADMQGGNIPNGSLTTGRQVIVSGYDASCAVGTDSDPYFEFDPCDWDADSPVAKPVYNSYTITQQASSIPRIFSIAEVKALCEGKQSVITENLRQMKNELLRDLNIKAGTTMMGLMSTYTDGVDSVTNPKTLNLISASTLNFLEFMKLKVEYGKKGYGQKLIAVGGDQLSYVSMLQNQLGLTSGGINLNGTPLPSMYNDFDLDGIFDDGDSHMLTWIPKTFQLLEWYNNEQAEAKFRGPVVELDGMTMYAEEQAVIDIDGLKVDLFMKYDKCGGYKMAINKWFDIGELPTGTTCTDKYPALGYIIACGSASC